MIKPLQHVSMQETVLVRGARQLLTLRGSGNPRRGAALGELAIIRDGAVLIREGRILQTGPSRRLENVAEARHAREINAAGRVVMPGFVDSRAQLWTLHPHSKQGETIHDDTEFEHRLTEIHALPARRLEAQARHVLAGMARHGTTTVSADTVPAPNRSGELKILRVLAKLHRKPLDMIPTYVGAQLVPPAFAGNQAEYVAFLCSELLPVIARRKLARFVAGDCGACGVASVRPYLTCARNLGLGLRVFAGANACGVRLALEMEAVTLAIDDIAGDEIPGLASSRTIAILAPASVFQRRLERYPPARSLIESGAAVALVSGFGLEDSPTYNMQMALSLACSEMRMSPAEAISAATINPAHALGCDAECGSLEIGKRADLLVLNVEDYGDMTHRFGINHVHMVLKNGVVVYQEGEVTDCSGK